jgi:tetratricopeptide (TPR) repeat protein
MDVADDYTDFLEACMLRSLDVVWEQMMSAGDAAPASDVRSFAMHTLDYAFRLPEIWGRVRQFLLALGPKMEQAGHRGEWLTLLQLAMEQSKKHHDMETEAELLYQRALLMRLLGQLAEADAAYQAAAGLFQALGDTVGLARVLGRHAFLAWVNRDLTAVERRVSSAEALLQEHENAVEERAYCKLVWGLFALTQQCWDDSVRRFQEAHDLWVRSGNVRMQAICLMNQGAPLLRANRLEEAAIVFEDARQIFERIQDSSNWALTTMNVGYAFHAQGRHLDALRLYAEAELLFRRTRDRYRLAELYNNQGEALRSLGRWEEAEDAYRLSIDLWRQLQNAEGLVNGLDNVSFVLIRQQKVVAALAALDEAKSLLETLPDSPRRVELSCTVQEKYALAQSSVTAETRS